VGEFLLFLRGEQQVHMLITAEVARFLEGLRGGGKGGEGGREGGREGRGGREGGKKEK
jgi:hypothetical protein